MKKIEPKWNHRAVLMLVAIIAVSALAAAGQQKVWTENNQRPESFVTDRAVTRQSFPKEFKLFDLNIEPLRQEMFSIVDSNGSSTVITVPNADGGIELFEVFEASNFEPELQARFPEIRAFSGRGITDRQATLKLSISAQGLQGTIFRVAMGQQCRLAHQIDRSKLFVVSFDYVSDEKFPQIINHPGRFIRNADFRRRCGCQYRSLEFGYQNTEFPADRPRQSSLCRRFDDRPDAVPGYDRDGFEHLRPVPRNGPGYTCTELAGKYDANRHLECQWSVVI